MIRRFSLGLLIVACFGGTIALATDDPVVSPKFTVSHTPQPVSAIAQTDTASGATTYVWNFRTDVHNGFDFPLRIISFGAVGYRDGVWQELATNSYTTEQFSEWYTAADSVVDGWIAPGTTVADAANWNRNNTQIDPRSRWTYLAEDQSGRQYLAYQEVILSPFVPAEAPWSDGGDGHLVDLTIRWAETGRALPPESQVRLSRRNAGSYSPYAVYPVAAGRSLQPQVRVPGMYNLQVFVPGFQLVEIPVVLAEDSAALELAVQATPNEQPPTTGEKPFTVDVAHAYLTEIWQLKVETDRSYREVAAAYDRYLAANDGSEFKLELGALPAELKEHLTDKYPLPVRCYAADLLPSVAKEMTAAEARLVADLLPADSAYLAADPRGSSLSASWIDGTLGTTRLADVAAHNPDHLVRGHATARLLQQVTATGDTIQAARLYEKLATEFADMSELDHIRRQLDPANRIRPGRMMPAFSAPLLSGDGQITETTAAGHFRLLHCWASWCGPCKAEMKFVHQTYEELHSQGLEILSFSLDRDPADALAYQEKKWHMPWPNAFLADGPQSPAGRAMEITGIPRLILIGPEGHILAVDGNLRGPQMVEIISGFMAR